MFLVLATYSAIDPPTLRGRQKNIRGNTPPTQTDKVKNLERGAVFGPEGVGGCKFTM